MFSWQITVHAWHLFRSKNRQWPRLLAGHVLPQSKICCQKLRHRSQCHRHHHHHHHHYRRRCWSVEYAASYFKVKIFGQFTEIVVTGIQTYCYCFVRLWFRLRSIKRSVVSMTGTKLFQTSWDKQSIRTHIKWKFVYFGRSYHTDAKWEHHWGKCIDDGVIVVALFACSLLCLHALQACAVSNTQRHTHTGQPYVLLQIHCNIFGSRKLLVHICLNGQSFKFILMVYTRRWLYRHLQFVKWVVDEFHHQIVSIKIRVFINLGFCTGSFTGIAIFEEFVLKIPWFEEIGEIFTKMTEIVDFSDSMSSFFGPKFHLLSPDSEKSLNLGSWCPCCGFSSSLVLTSFHKSRSKTVFSGCVFGILLNGFIRGGFSMLNKYSLEVRSRLL